MNSVRILRMIAVLVMFATVAGAARAAEPSAGQSLPTFQENVRAFLATQGDKMGYALAKCALTPSFAIKGDTYLGRAFSQRSDTIIMLLAAENDVVSRWQEFDLPNLEGWFTHQTWRCQGSTLTIGSGRSAQRYRWDGQSFSRLGR